MKRRLLTALGFRECTEHGWVWAPVGMCPPCFERDVWPEVETILRDGE